MKYAHIHGIFHIFDDYFANIPSIFSKILVSYIYV